MSRWEVINTHNEVSAEFVFAECVAGISRREKHQPNIHTAGDAAAHKEIPRIDGREGRAG
ncbi:uncharacterized protein H6S33_012637 [Morchella sextelata]|uniref:uncharacterized protein n=1 Tax=Morchella sextelata TaxID=1174677 RepID=UPI001D0554AF|nr:uncharacterized protein H6S33_012637 [Morchella sextelata]KAH0610091.1 hypothetical protein H6S33_012637 [Morchella sextelata]